MKEFTVAPISTPEQILEWDALVARSPHGTVFHHHWWLKNAGANFKILGVRDTAGSLVGGIPLTFSKRYGLKLVRNPPLTPYLGPIVDDAGDPLSYKSITLMRDVASTLAESIDGIDSFGQRVGPRGPDLQGFMWGGFSAEMYYTFVIFAEHKPDAILGRMHPKHRAELHKAERRGIRVIESDDIDVLIRLNKLTFKRQGLEPPYEESQVRSLWNAARSRGHATLLLAQNADGKTTDGALVFTDAKSCYLVLVGGDPDERGRGGGNAVIWEGIQRALASGRGFDFEGSSIPNIEFFYRRWGGVPFPTMYLQKTLTRKAYVAGFLKSCLARA